MIRRESKLTFAALVRNLGFLIKTLPFAWKRAEAHYLRAAELSSQIGAKGMLGQAHWGLGRLYRARGKHQKAVEDIEKAIANFKACNATDFLRLAEEFKNESRSDFP